MSIDALPKRIVVVSMRFAVFSKSIEALTKRIEVCSKRIGVTCKNIEVTSENIVVASMHFMTNTKNQNVARTTPKTPFSGSQASFDFRTPDALCLGERSKKIDVRERLLDVRTGDIPAMLKEAGICPDPISQEPSPSFPEPKAMEAMPGQPERGSTRMQEAASMDKRYQVFVSSTYIDLKEERDQVMRAIIAMNHMPRGMEWFPASDKDPLSVIKPIIDDCDYYVLIIKGRYGHLTDAEISMTQTEYEYAESAGKQILVFPYATPDDLPLELTDDDENKKVLLDAFRTKASEGHTHCSWENPWELAMKVSQSLGTAIRDYPAEGWVRANVEAQTDVVAENNVLMKENIELKKSIKQVKQEHQLPRELNLADLKETFSFQIDYYCAGRKGKMKSDEIVLSWEQLFAIVAPKLIEHPSDAKVRQAMATAFFPENMKESATSTFLDEQVFYTIRTQLATLGLVKVRRSETTNGSYGVFWVLTEKGRGLMLQLRTVKAK